MKTEVRTVTPNVAKEMLNRNFNNRRLNESHVRFLSNQMKDNKWLFDGQPIRFDIHSRLLDGQHRLNAIVESETSQDFLIISGLPEETFQVMDTGKNRNGSDAFSILGHDNSAAIAAAITFIIRFKKGKFRKASGSDKVSNSDLLEWAKQNPSIHEDVKKSVKFYREFNKVLPLSIISSLYFIMKEIDTLYADDFIRKLCTGLGLEEGSPISFLRKKLTEDKLNTAKLPMQDKLALIIKGWNLYRKGETCVFIRWNKEIEKFPKMI
jgi:hypothetical protein